MKITPFEITCVILSGGKSSRMGEDKSLLPFSSSSLIEFQYKRLKPYFKDIFISSKLDKFDFLDDKTKLIIDKNQDIYSPILALQTTFETLDDEKVFIITVDTPFIKYETIKKLIDYSNNFEITIAQTPFGTHNLCGVFSKLVLSTIEEMLEENIHKINFLIKNRNNNIISFSNEDEFLNINTKDEYIRSLSSF